MRSVGFLRNPWKKRAQKLSDGQDCTENDLRNYQDATSHFANTSTAAGCALTVEVERLPPNGSIPSLVEGSWSYPSRSTHKRSERTLVRRDSSRLGLDVPYHGHGTMFTGGQKQSGTSSTSPLQFSTQTSNRFNRSPLPASYDSKDVLVSLTNSPTHPRQSSFHPFPQSQTLPSFPLPNDLDHGPRSKCDKRLEIRVCRCSQPPDSTHRAYCPKFTLSDAQKSATVSSSLHTIHKTVHADLDLSVDRNPRPLYRSTGSTPYLPCDEQADLSARPESSACSGESSDADNFPLSLFPAPPPLLVRKRIPTPLVLRPRLPSFTLSSRDSTPIGTPTTPLFHSLNSPSQSSIASPTKKSSLGRTSAAFSPPPTSPPNGPLPDLPPLHDRSPEKLTHILRTAQSNAHLRGALPYLATHRVTSSEPNSDHSSSPIKRPTKLLDPASVQDNYKYMDLKEQPISTTNMDAHVQWGYAL